MAAGRSIRQDCLALARAAGGRTFFLLAVLTAVFVLGLFNLRADKILFIPSSIEEVGKEDLLAFYRGSELALEGRAAGAYDRDTFRATLPESGENLLFLNPPHFFLMIAPLSLLPYGATKMVWMGLNIAAMASIALMAARGRVQTGVFLGLAFLSPAAFGSFFCWQMAPFVAAGLAAALLQAEKRPLLAGALLALLTVKPQYGLAAPALLLALGNYRAIAAAAGFSAALVALSVAVFGAATWSAFFVSLSANHAPHATQVARDMLTVHQAAAKLGLLGPDRWAVQGLAILALGLACYAGGKRWPKEAAVGFALIASAAASPSLWVYDWPIVMAGLFFLARAAGPWPFSLQVAAFGAWIGPLISMGFATMASSIVAPVLLLLALTLFYAHLEKLRLRAAPAGGLPPSWSAARV